MSVITIPDSRDPRTIDKVLLLEPNPNLPPDARQVATAFARLAQQMVNTLKDGDQLLEGFQKLIEARDCFVRQSLRDGGEDPHGSHNR